MISKVTSVLMLVSVEMGGRASKGRGKSKFNDYFPQLSPWNGPTVPCTPVIRMGSATGTAWNFLTQRGEYALGALVLWTDHIFGPGSSHILHRTLPFLLLKGQSVFPHPWTFSGDV